MTQPPSWNSGQGGQPDDAWQRGYQVPPSGGDPFAFGPAPGRPWPGYEGPPAPGGQQPQDKPPRDNVQWIIAGIAAALVVAIVVVGVVWKLNHGKETQQATTATTSSSTSAPPSSSPTKTTSTTAAPAPQAAGCEGKTAPPAPGSPAGWQTVVGKRGLAYDVPPDWEVLKCSVLVGWEKKCPESPESPFGTCPIRTMSGAAALHASTCAKPTGSISVAGTPGAKNEPDVRQAVNDEASLVKDIYTSDSGVAPSVSLGAPRDLTVGGAPAVEIVATVTNIVGDSCGATNALHVMVATTVPGQEGSVMFVAALGFQGAPDTALPAQLVASLRPTN